MVLQFPMIYSWRLEGRDKSDGLRLKQEGGEGEICGVKVWMESSALLFPFLNASLSLTWSSSWLQRSSKWTGCTTMGRGWLKRAWWPNCNFTHLINRPFQHTHLLRWVMNLLRFVQKRHWLFNLQAGAAKRAITIDISVRFKHSYSIPFVPPLRENLRKKRIEYLLLGIAQISSHPPNSGKLVLFFG